MSKPSTNVTIRDVAQKAGVSAATVSLVIQGKGTLKDKTRETVLRVIEQTGYRRRVKPTLNDMQKHFVVIVDDIANPYFHEVMRGLDAVLAENGGFASILTSQDSIERQSGLLDGLWGSDIGGIVLVPASGTSHKDLIACENRRRPLIMAVRRIGRSPFDYVGANPLVGVQLATEHLIELGHKDIALIGGYKSNHAYGERYAGFASSLMQHSLPLNENRVFDGGSSREFGRVAMQNLLDSPTSPPTAVIAYNDLVAFGVMDALRAKNLAPGHDIAVIGYDDVPEAALQPVPLTSVATSAVKLGEVIGQAILNKSSGIDEENPLDITIPPRLIIRSSCGHSLADHDRTDEGAQNVV